MKSHPLLSFHIFIFYRWPIMLNNGVVAFSTNTIEINCTTKTQPIVLSSNSRVTSEISFIVVIIFFLFLNACYYTCALITEIPSRRCFVYPRAALANADCSPHASLRNDDLPVVAPMKIWFSPIILHLCYIFFVVLKVSYFFVDFVSW